MLTFGQCTLVSEEGSLRSEIRYRISDNDVEVEGETKIAVVERFCCGYHIGLVGFRAFFYYLHMRARVLTITCAYLASFVGNPLYRVFGGWVTVIPNSADGRCLRNPMMQARLSVFHICIYNLWFAEWR